MILVDADSAKPLGAAPIYHVELDGRLIPVQGRLLNVLLDDPELLKPATIVIPYIAAAGRVTMLAAREKVGKSTLVAYAVACKTSGRDLFGEPVEPGAVLWVGLEEAAADAVARFHAMGADDSKLTLVTRLVGDGGLQQLRAEIAAAKPEVVVIDSLAAYGGGLEDENNATAVTALLKPLVDFVHDSGIALVLLHHANKSSSGTGHYRGSVAIGAAMDMILEMAEVEPMSNRRRVSAKGRFPLKSYEIDYDPETQSYSMLGTARTPAERVEDLQVAVLEWVRANPNAGKERIRTAMGRNATKTDLAIDALVEAGRLRHLGQRQGYVAIA